MPAFRPKGLRVYTNFRDNGRLALSVGLTEIPAATAQRAIPGFTLDQEITPKEEWKIIQAHLKNHPGGGFTYERPITVGFDEDHVPAHSDVWEIHPDGIAREPFYKVFYPTLLDLPGMVADQEIYKQFELSPSKYLTASPERWMQIVALADRHRANPSHEFHRVLIEVAENPQSHVVDTPRKLYDLADRWMSRANAFRNAELQIRSDWKPLLIKLLNLWIKHEDDDTVNSEEYFDALSEVENFNWDKLNDLAALDQRPVHVILAQLRELRCHQLESVVSQHIFTLTGTAHHWGSILDGPLTGLADIMRTAKSQINQAADIPAVDALYQQASADIKKWRLPE